MAFGEPRLDTIDDVSALLSSIRERLTIVAQRQRMNLTEDDAAEFEGAYEECDRIHALVLHLRAHLSDDYLSRIGHKVSERDEAEIRAQFR